jgi:hypothetical protein
LLAPADLIALKLTPAGDVGTWHIAAVEQGGVWFFGD